MQEMNKGAVSGRFHLRAVFFFWRRREGLNHALLLSYFRMVELKGLREDLSAHGKMEFNQY